MEYSKKEKLNLLKAFIYYGQEEYRTMVDVLDPDGTKNERLVDNEWADWLVDEFNDLAENWLEEYKVKNMAYFISNEYLDLSEDNVVEEFFESYRLEPFDLVKYIVRAVMLYDDELFDDLDPEEINNTADEIFGGITFTKKLIKEEFTRAYNLIRDAE